MREPVIGEDGIEGVPSYIARTHEAVTDFGEPVDVRFVPVLVTLLQWEGPEVPESLHVKAGVRPISPALYQSSGYLVGDVFPLSLLCCFLYLPNTPAPQVVPETARGAALVLQENELLVR